MITQKAAFAEQNLGLVHLCANRFRSRGIEYDDLYSAGCIGLMKAVSGFDDTRGIKFSTYAVPVILGEIKRLFRDGGSIKISRSIKELSMRAVRERERFSKEMGREPLISELSTALQSSDEAIIEALCVSQSPVSLTEITEDGQGQIDLPVDAPDIEIGDILSLRQVMEHLNTADRELLYLRYFKNNTQTETAKKLSMTQVQVSRREKKLLLELRTELLS